MDIIFGNQNWVGILVGAIIWGIFAIVFLNFTRGSGKYLFTLFSIIYIVLFIINPLMSFLVVLVAGVLLIIRRKHLSISKKKYRKAIAKFEAGGIRRGLTPPEIGAVLGIPFRQILTLVFVGLLDKGFVVIGDAPNFRLKVSKSMQTRTHSLNPEKRATIRRQAAQELRQVLFPFEEPILEMFEQEDGKGIAEIDFGVTIKPFFQSVAERVGGYNLDKTREYYGKMVRKFSEDGNSEGFTDTRGDRVIEWKLLRTYLDDEYTLNHYERPNWFFDAKDTLGIKQSNKTVVDWVNSLEDVIKSGLSQEDFKINLGRMMNEISSEVLEEILHATYHI